MRKPNPNATHRLLSQNAGSLLGSSPFEVETGSREALEAKVRDLVAQDDAQGRYSMVYWVEPIRSNS